MGYATILLNIMSILIFIITIILLIIFCFQFIAYIFKKRSFPKKLSIAVFIGIAFVSIRVANETIFFTWDTAEGEFLEGPVESPTGKYIANAYYETYGGAAGGVVMWIDITDQESEESQTIYYSNARSEFSMEWDSEETLAIVNEERDYPSASRSVTLNVGEEIYDASGRACWSWILTYKSCLTS